jgi:type 1 glutamine amidotransferase
MKKRNRSCFLRWLPVILSTGALTFLSPVFSQAQPAQRVLIITGGHEFERDAFFHMFAEMPGIEYREVIQPEANRLYGSDLMDRFDVLLFYDMVQEIDDAQKEALINLLEEGKGVVFLHHSLVSYQEWDEFEKITGGRYLLSGNEQDSSTYRHDVEIPVSVLDRNHPVMDGVDDFTVHDEVYGNFKVLPAVHPLLGTKHPESGNIIGWTNHYGKSGIVYIQPGHDHSAYDHPSYRRIIRQAIQWVQNQSK